MASSHCPPKRPKSHSDDVLSPTRDGVAGTASQLMWVTVPSGGGTRAIRMELPTASFLPGCHMAGSSRRGTKEMAQRGSKSIWGHAKQTEIWGLQGEVAKPKVPETCHLHGSRPQPGDGSLQ